MSLYPPVDAALEDYRTQLRLIPTRTLEADREYWSWSLAELATDWFVQYEDQTGAFMLFKLEEINRELARRKELAQHHYAPHTPEGYPPDVPPAKRERYDAVKAHYQTAEFIGMAAGRRFRPSGKLLVTNCPLGLHEDRTPSFKVWPDQHWYCFACHLGGSIIDFFMAYYHLDRDAALLAAEEEAGITPLPPVVVHRRKEGP